MDPVGMYFHISQFGFRISSISLVCPETLNFDARNGRKKGAMKEFPFVYLGSTPRPRSSVANEALNWHSRG